MSENILVSYHAAWLRLTVCPPNWKWNETVEIKITEEKRNTPLPASPSSLFAWLPMFPEPISTVPSFARPVQPNSSFDCCRFWLLRLLVLLLLLRLLSSTISLRHLHYQSFRFFLLHLAENMLHPYAIRPGAMTRADTNQTPSASTASAHITAA